MDNKPKLSGLDPKLQEAYERVMGTTVPAPSAKPAAPAQAPAGQSPLGGATTSPMSVQPGPKIEPILSSIPQPAPQADETFTPSTSEQVIDAKVPSSNSQIFSTKKKGGKISPAIIMLAAVVFFLVYTLVWLKIFNVKLPFLP